MEKNLLAVQENIRIIQEEITKLKEQMDQKDNMIFLKEEAHRNRRINGDVQQLAVTDETLPVEKFDHPYLLNTVLRETLDAINRVSVTLDVETANPDLVVSEDRKSDQLKSSLDSLTKKKSDFQEKEQQQKEKISGVRKQSHSVQSHITSQFAELRRIITEKEQSSLRDLREEEKRILNPMEKNLREIQENIRFIQEEILKLTEQIDQIDGVIFLKEEARRKRRINDDIQELSVTDEALPVGKFVHPYLLNTVLREKLDTIKQVSVTLDVETANQYLEVSEDRKSVRRTGIRRNLPDTGKRFTFWPCVLGSEGFTSGKHYWEVEVTGNRFWWLGVAAESVERKRRVRLSPETGFWVIGRFGDVLHRDYDVFRGLPSPGARLAAGPIPGKVGVYLSYESGTVSFYNAQTKTHLHTFTGNKFTGNLYPFFRTGLGNQWLRICSGSAPGL
ncbi:zinc-binding protein A33-like [Hemitrygon akajei]|uniref:zinc-binding protein A33-like n=1 Tax=Hemitrygon akajei TaxID=2704970 RepID=UPI003BF97F01